MVLCLFLGSSSKSLLWIRGESEAVRPASMTLFEEIFTVQIDEPGAFRFLVMTLRGKAWLEEMRSVERSWAKPGLTRCKNLSKKSLEVIDLKGQYASPLLPENLFAYLLVECFHHFLNHYRADLLHASWTHCGPEKSNEGHKTRKTLHIPGKTKKITSNSMNLTFFS